MMIFSITLTANQIHCLRRVAAFHDGLEDSAFLGIPDFIAGSRRLISEGLVLHHGPSCEGHKAWEITNKGRIILRLVELDVKDFLKQIEAEPKKEAGNGKPKKTPARVA